MKRITILFTILILLNAMPLYSRENQQPEGNGKYSLQQNFPNPFNPSTRIKFSIPYNSHVKLTVYDVVGREIKILVNETKNAGSHEVTYNTNELPAGIYFYKIDSGSFSEIKRMILLK